MTVPVQYVDSPPQNTLDMANKLAALANQVGQEMLASGKATSQIVIHYSNYDSEIARARAERLTLENELLRARIESTRATVNVGVQLEEVMDALRSYTVSGST